MRNVVLGEIAEFSNGKRQVSSNGNFPVYGGNGIQSFCSLYNAQNCCVIGRVGANCGVVYFVDGKFWASDNSIIAKPKYEIDSTFLYYLLKQLNLNKFSSGTSQPLLTQSALNQITCKIPSYPIQIKIGLLLHSLDSKIELNRRINDNLFFLNN